MAIDIVNWYNTLPTWIILLVTIWILVWKGLALWKSAKLKQPIWFILILIFNTLGILEILYIFIFSGLRINKNNLREPPKKKIRKKSRR